MIWTTGLLALLELREGQPLEALVKARKVMTEMAAWRSVSFYSHPGVYAATNVYSSFWPMTARRNPPTWDRSLHAPKASACVSSHPRPVPDRGGVLRTVAWASADAARTFELATTHAQQFELAASLSAIRRWRKRLGA